MFQMQPPTDRRQRSFPGLRQIVATLRGPGGCPWDRVQTHETLRPYLLEETAETLEALDRGDPDDLCEELGDLLFEVLLHIQIAEERGDFTLSDVFHSISDKLVRRHPHVFGDAIAPTPDAVIEQWDKLKAGEREGASAMDAIAATLPALAYAQAHQRRASSAGFAFETAEQVWEALDEELEELRAAATHEDRRQELGDAMFALANLARWYETDAEDALRNTSRSFAAIFRRMEQIMIDRSISLDSAPLEQKLALWQEAKSADAHT
jgi:tetrapyrrole methylase family protein/MazG family protein